MEGKSEIPTISQQLDSANNLTVKTKEHTEKKTAKFSCKQKIALIMMCTADFMSFCSMSIMAPFYPLEATNKGMSESMAGFVFGYYALIVFLSSPVFGKLLPKLGAKYVYIGGLLVSGLCALIFGTLHYVNDYSIFASLSFIIRGFEALGASAYTTAGYVIISNVFPDHAGTVRGLLETFVGLGMSAGPGIGGLLFAFGGFGLPFYVIGVAIIVTVPLNVYLLPTVENPEFGTKSISLISLLKLSPILVTCVIMTTVSMTWGFLDPTLEPHLRKFHLSPSNVGLIFLLSSAMYGIFCPAWGWLADKLETYWWLMTTGLFGNSVILVLLGPSPLFLFLSDSVWSNILCLSALGVFVAMGLMPTYQFLLDGCLENGLTESLGTHAVIAGLWSSVYSLGEVLGPVLGGFLMENFGFPITSTVFAALNFVISILCTIYFSYRKKPPVTDFMPIFDGEIKAEYYSNEISELSVEKCMKLSHPVVENVKTK